MKTLTTILAAAILLSSCTKTNTTCVFKSDCSISIESEFATKKFMTKEELKEKDAQLFKVTERNMF
ncbi:MAG: hypothetical protein KA163_11820 [Bacteroidia bacterium]|nr:hypothetical protein [Bacteroidia bacterium]